MQKEILESTEKKKERRKERRKERKKHTLCFLLSTDALSENIKRFCIYYDDRVRFLKQVLLANLKYDAVMYTM